MANPIIVNPSGAARRLTTGVSDWLWVVTAIMGTSMLLVLMWSFVQRRGARAFHHVVVFVLLVSTITYFAMASDLGQTIVRAEFRTGSGVTRSVFYVRYIQWFINAPLILLLLLLTTGLSLSEIFLTLAMIEVTVVSGLVGALIPTSYKWGFYVFGVLALFYVAFSLLFDGLKSPLVARKYKSMYGGLAIYLSVVWMLYPICWAFAEGANVLTLPHEMVFYSILDLFAGPVFLFCFLFSLQDLEYDDLGLQSGKASDYVNVERGARRTEKAEERGP
ncbi:family A G protein-coupled receptor-like protein [Russula dissimulans]|nr:family A G protein-coupled receptor-like protein [Russula dissimulans]